MCYPLYNKWLFTFSVSLVLDKLCQSIFQYTEKNVGRNRNQQVTVNGLNQDEFKISLRACFNALKDLCPR